MLNPLRGKQACTIGRGRGEDTCDRVLLKSSLSVKHVTRDEDRDGGARGLLPGPEERNRPTVVHRDTRDADDGGVFRSMARQHTTEVRGHTLSHNNRHPAVSSKGGRKSPGRGGWTAAARPCKLHGPATCERHAKKSLAVDWLSISVSPCTAVVLYGHAPQDSPS